MVQGLCLKVCEPKVPDLSNVTISGSPYLMISTVSFKVINPIWSLYTQPIASPTFGSIFGTPVS